MTTKLIRGKWADLIKIVGDRLNDTICRDRVQREEKIIYDPDPAGKNQTLLAEWQLNEFPIKRTIASKHKKSYRRP